MDIKSKIRKELRRVYGPFETYLELEYESTLIEKLSSNDEKKRVAWITYNQLILELKDIIKDSLHLKKLQYQLTDISDPNEVCIEVIKELPTKTTEIERLLCKIMNFN